jgi:hypothetical protein
MIIHFLGLQLKLLHNAYYISPIFHTNSTLISHIIKAAKAVPHCFAMTNTIWQNQVPVIYPLVYLDFVNLQKYLDLIFIYL